MAAAGLSFVIDGHRADGSAEQAALEKGAGQIVQVRSHSCSKIDFDNRNGRLGDRQSIPCPDRRNLQRDYQFPANRVERFSKGFSR
jgi:hypothetical protein